MRDSNPRPSAWQADILSTELISHMAGMENYDISTYRLTAGRSASELHPNMYLALKPPEAWWSCGDSNPRPPRCKRGILSTELQPHIKQNLSIHLLSTLRRDHNLRSHTASCHRELTLRFSTSHPPGPDSSTTSIFT